VAVIDPRKKIVNFRVSEAEFDQLRAACLRNGARSISDFARACMMLQIEANCDREALLDHRIAELETQMELLLRLVRPAGISL
jgi:hypothetical protein